MKWTEITVFATEDGLDAVCGRLAMLGIDQVAIELGREEVEAFLRDTAKYWDFADMDALCAGEPCVKAYVADAGGNAALVKEVKDSFAALRRGEASEGLGSLRVLSRVVDDEDWANSWKANYKPFRIGERLFIRPSWENEYDAGGRTVISLDPGMAFGSDTHQTTRMCLEALERHVKPGCMALDLGCGSGILGIAALLLGAKRATLADIDPVAEKVAGENARMNGIGEGRRDILIGDLLSDASLRERISGAKYGIVTANIVASVVIALMPLVRGLIKKDGVFIASGIIGERLDEVLEALEANGFGLIELNADEDWRQLAARLKR
ncbi:MAG TPA: 50S ribosomal protein L11 methyltransferase [Clostridia bacterium]|nr:50S ribosomal protein L11 methyltransferase [Clostridia bacterium]